MSFLDVVARVVSRPAGRVVEAPVRDVVDEVLRSQPLASASDLRALSAEIDRVSGQIRGLEDRLKVLVDAVTELQTPNEDEDPKKVAEKSASEMLDEAREMLIKAAVAAAERAAHDAVEKAITARVAELAPAPVKAAPVKAAPAKAAPVKAAAAEKAPVKAEKKAPAKAEKKTAKADKPAAKKAEQPAAKKAEKAVAKKAEQPAAKKGCKVSDCTRKYRAKGFCGLHYQAWRRGNMEGFVSPEGLVYHGEQVLQVADGLAGSAYDITGRGKTLKVKVGGKVIEHTGK